MELEYKKEFNLVEVAPYWNVNEVENRVRELIAEG